MKKWIEGQRQLFTCRMPLCNFPLKWEMSLIMVNYSRTLTKSGLDMRRLRMNTKEYGRDVGSS